MNLYAIIIPNGTRTPKWGFVRSKRKALRIAKRECAQVWYRPDIPEITAWDWPTFRQGATQLIALLSAQRHVARHVEKKYLLGQCHK